MFFKKLIYKNYYTIYDTYILRINKISLNLPFSDTNTRMNKLKKPLIV